MLHKGADHTTIAMHDQPAGKPLSSSVIKVTLLRARAGTGRVRQMVLSLWHAVLADCTPRLGPGAAGRGPLRD
jgi:hypothetical protein